MVEGEEDERVSISCSVLQAWPVAIDSNGLARHLGYQLWYALHESLFQQKSGCAAITNLPI